MKKLSDYQGEEAIELWADLLDPLTEILTDENVKKVVQSGKAPLVIAKEILKSHSKEATEILLRIDPEPITGLNIIIRLVAVLSDIGSNPDVKSFFGFAVQAQTADESSGLPTETTEGAEK